MWGVRLKPFIITALASSKTVDVIAARGYFVFAGVNP